ncbi:hypothetical protein J2X68_003823 [Streptomyces sp. 3330]|nr:hypothetical protein [Streptomyces sp. 3330]
MSGSTSAADIGAGYAFAGLALPLGALLWDGACPPEVPVRTPCPPSPR